MQAAVHSTCKREGSNNHWEYTILDEGFNSILGSVNGASTIRMLLNHQVQLQYRTVDWMTLV